jgi:ribonucleoside-diphosphate reductase beta chain
MSTTRSIAHGQRTGYASLEAGRLCFDSFPMRLFTKGNARHWNPADIDFSQDAADVAAMTDRERWLTSALAAQFMAGEESVTQDLQPFIAAMAAEGRLADEMYLTQFLYEEAKHTESFRRWFDAVGMTDDLHEYVDFNDSYTQIFAQELPASLYALHDDPSPANQVRASVTYNHVVEGALALTGYFGWGKVCASRGILPGMQQIVKLIGDDERRHMAWGTFTCRRHVAADDDLWSVVNDRLDELFVPAVGVIANTFDHFGDADPPFGISVDEMTGYAADRLNRRLGTIESARGADLLSIDTDADPERLEETFHAEDQAALAQVAEPGAPVVAQT